jgi:large subunit ribosomal protein L3
MLPAILGRKIGMTQVYDETGLLHPVTVVQAGPCTVLQVKTRDGDGYSAVQLGFDDVKAQRAKKPQIGHAAASSAKPKRFVREFRMDEGELDVESGQTITVELFDEVSTVDVVATSKGRGYSGGMRRHNFKGQLASHGVERKHRSPGSIASHATNAGTGPKLKKGKRMAGQYGNTRCTVRNQRLVGVDKDNDLLLIRGAIPGPNGGYVMVRRSKAARQNA